MLKGDYLKKASWYGEVLHKALDVDSFGMTQAK
jgi:hypothetical protein